jgi:hypothetical protein
MVIGCSRRACKARGRRRRRQSVVGDPVPADRSQTFVATGCINPTANTKRAIPAGMALFAPRTLIGITREACRLRKASPSTGVRISTERIAGSWRDRWRYRDASRQYPTCGDFHAKAVRDPRVWVPFTMLVLLDPPTPPFVISSSGHWQRHDGNLTPCRRGYHCRGKGGANERSGSPRPGQESRARRRHAGHGACVRGSPA